jgi:hypothetical protein
MPYEFLDVEVAADYEADRQADLAFEERLAAQQYVADREYRRQVLDEDGDPDYYEGDDDLGWVEDRDPAEYNDDDPFY